MRLQRNQYYSLTKELKDLGYSTADLQYQIPAQYPSRPERPAQTTRRFNVDGEQLLFIDEQGAFVNQRFFSPFECVTVPDLKPNRVQVLGSINRHCSLRKITAFLIEADIIRTFIDIGSIMKIHQIHSRMVKVQGFHTYHSTIKNMDPFGFTVSMDQFQHLNICAHAC